ncbi:hypothetical protein R3W88_024326 [Solanum pinnatisectum]|uniref:Uncharacterized protein n=1 Tax=Solanum pinnatisectum TaxID=50273 RepID=A0AAV9M0U1_9SOLN|nr:hypothetical protein R3W88_024326 [Solanum pinnatisectum]
MPGYAKFMKELVIKKRSLDFETIKVSHSCSAIMTKELIKKREDPGAFTIPCTIGMLQFAKALCNFGGKHQLNALCDIQTTWAGALVDIESRELKFRVNEDEVTFNVCKSMKHPSDINVVSTVDVIDEAVASVSHLMCMSEPFEAVLLTMMNSKFKAMKR